jgi:predicted ATPase
MSQHAFSLARQLGHSFSLSDVLCFGGCLYDVMRRDVRALQEHAEELLRLAERAQTWLPSATWFRGAAMVMMGNLGEGMPQLREGIALQESAGKLCYIPVALGVLAGAQMRADEYEAGLITLGEALSLVEETDERHWEPELHRLHAELLLAQGNEAEAEASLHKAIDVARSQSARSWELRATTSLARLWQGQGKIGQAHEMLAGIYDWFTEGFDTADLKEAKSLLKELAS